MKQLRGRRDVEMRVIRTLQKTSTTLSYLLSCEGLAVRGQRGKGSLDVTAYIFSGNAIEGDDRKHLCLQL